MTEVTEIGAWAASGAMALTGRRDGPPQLVAGAPATAVRNDLAALAGIAGAVGLDADPLPDERVLSERAAVMGLRRQGAVSAGGATRILDAADGQIAITLSRPSDFDLLPALLERAAVSAEPWQDLAEWAGTVAARETEERAALLGLAAGAVDHALPVETLPAEPNNLRLSEGSERRKRLGSAVPLVVDLSALWAGPLCAHLLGLLGAHVISVESTQRPDPTQETSPDFHRLLHLDAEHLSLDFTAADDLRRLRDLLLRADIVIESSRPRALAQLGIDADAIVAESGHCTWVSITAYGRTANRIGYGDDVAAAAGLLGDGPVFAGDAIADPMTGTHATLMALSHWANGSNGIVEASMYDVVRTARTPLPDAAVVQRADDWFVDDGSQLIAVREPAVRERSR